MNQLVLLACAVCGAGEDRASGALLVMTIIISLLPLGMMGGLIGYFVYQSRKGDQAAEDAK